ncbi:MAG: alpha-L-fucosidase [Ferruginibacter sp.]
MRISIIVSVYLLPLTTIAQPTNYATILKGESEKEIITKAAHVFPTPRQLRWQKLELTAFFHFGINTFTNKEWGTGKEDISLFNPKNLDAFQWVNECKKAGIKQVIITAKHHDGFCLWPSKYTEHSVKNTSWKNGGGDVVKEVSEACKKLNIGFGIYLSPWDMNNSSYGTAAYNDFFTNQLTELLSNYGKVDEVWFDGANGEGPNGKKQEYDFERWYTLIRKLQPQAVIAIMGPDVRWVGTETGYGREQEWSVVPVGVENLKITSENSQTSVDIKPAGDMRGSDLGSRNKILNAEALVWYPAETDVSIRPGWFYHESEDSLVKKPEKLLDIYFNSVGKNTVLLLNIPPNKEGLLSDADIKSLQGWKTLRDKVFENNLVKNAKLVLPVKQSKTKIIDNDNSTNIFFNEESKEYIVQVDFKKPSLFNICQLQENISLGQRVESFVLEVWQHDKWITITEGTTIGYKRLLQFKKVEANKIRLRIVSSRLQPNLAEFGLYLFENEKQELK